MHRLQRTALFLAVALCFVARSASSPAATIATEQLGHWGDLQLSKATNVAGAPTPTTVRDYFGPNPHSAVASGGLRLLTAGKGSTWVYDSVHHVAAVSESGDVNGNTVFYLHNPATHFPERDLSHVVSAHGLRLGIAPGLAAKLLGVAPTAIVRSSEGNATLYVRKPYRCLSAVCSHDATVIFLDGKAVAISLDDVGP